MTTKAKKPSKASPTKQALQDEVVELRAQLAEAEVLFEYREFRSQALSKMLNLGIWEWDEKADKPLSYSDELADVFGVDTAGLKKLFQNRNNFEGIVHPDDLETEFYYRPDPGFIGQDEFRYRAFTLWAMARQEKRSAEQNIRSAGGLFCVQYFIFT